MKIALPKYLYFLPCLLAGTALAQPARWEAQGAVEGRVYWDANQNCTFDAGDVPLPGVLVAADAEGLAALTDADGRYRMALPLGTFALQALAEAGAPACAASPTATIGQAGQTAQGADFAFQEQASGCRNVVLQIASAPRRPCQTGRTAISYRNPYPYPQANTRLALQLPSPSTPVASSLPFATHADGYLVFDLGTLPPLASGQFWVEESVDCQAGLAGALACAEVWLLDPADACADADTARVRIEASCFEGQRVRFRLRNVREEIQQGSYRICRNGLLFTENTFGLGALQEQSLLMPADGAEYRLEVRGPGPDAPLLAAHTEAACTRSAGTGAAVPHQAFPNPVPRNSRALACATILPDAPGPRLLEVSPSGLSENRYVPMGQMLEYQLSFENTASDTVQDLLLTHPLPASLDAGTLRLGPASHPYVASLQGDSLKTLVFAFSGLDLPGGQRGFVSFQLQPNDGLEAPAVVGHRALVQFGNGPALASDSAWVTYADTVLLSPAYDDAYDALPPTIALSLPDGEYWNRPFQVRVDLSEPVALSASMFRVENGQAGALTGGGLRYNLRVVPQNEGPVAVSVEAGAFVDASGNPVLEGSSATAVFDITPPRFAISITASGESLASPFELSIESSEITTALGAGSLRLDAGELQSFERDGDRYLLQALADENGQLIFELPAGSATDRAGNPNLRAGGSFRLPHIDGQGEFFDIILFPNPATDLLRVEQRLPGLGIVIQVLDVSGRLMGAVTTDEQVETIDVSPLRPGLYIVRVFHPDYIESRTFMKR